MTDLKLRIMNNGFVSAVRNEMRIDEGAYLELCGLLRELAGEWACRSLVDKELALVLYSIPQIVRNAFLSFSGPPDALPAVARALEDMWVELDGLVLDCFSTDTPPEGARFPDGTSG